MLSAFTYYAFLTSGCGDEAGHDAFVEGRDAVYTRAAKTTFSWHGHTNQKAPDPVRSRKLTWFGRD